MLDQYVKRILKAKHYGRYVDDVYIISRDKEFLKKFIVDISKFLKENLDLELQMNKVQIKEIKYGVEFLGAYIKPYRLYVSNKTLRRIKKVMNETYKDMEPEKKLIRFKSYQGLFSHFKNYRIMEDLFLNYFC